MWKFVLFGMAVASVAFGQPAVSAVQVANLEEDVRGLSERVGDLSLRVEQLEHANGDLLKRLASGDRNYATVNQLNDAIDNLNRTIQSAVAASKTETLQHVAVEMDKLAKETNAALDSLARSEPGGLAAPKSVSRGSSKDVARYTVQKGDTLAVIARRTGARIDDIVNANKLADPSRIRVGETLLIPNPPKGAVK